MNTYVWYEDSGSGYIFWKTFFRYMFPDYIVETKSGNSHLNKAIENIDENENFYYVIIDTAVDNLNVFRELLRLKRIAGKKKNIRLIELHSFEFLLLTFEYL